MMGIVCQPMKLRYVSWLMIIVSLSFCPCLHCDELQPPDADRDVQAAPPLPSTGVRPERMDPEDEIKAYLVCILGEKGLEPGYARVLVEDPRLVFDPGFILKNLRTAPPKASPKTPGIMEYDPVYVTRGRDFMETYREQLRIIEERFGTSPEIITSILIVETRLGTYPLKYRAMRVFANMTLAQDPVFIASLEGHYSALSRLLKEEETLKAATAKAKWASGELYELIVLAGSLGLDPHEIIGSVSGALGPAQFIPSTFRKYGVDGNGDGRKDPFDMADAMASIGSYLSTSGWREGADEQRLRTAIWRYNHSDIYVNTILKLYRELSDT